MTDPKHDRIMAAVVLYHEVHSRIYATFAEQDQAIDAAEASIRQTITGALAYVRALTAVEEHRSHCEDETCPLLFEHEVEAARLREKLEGR